MYCGGIGEDRKAHGAACIGAWLRGDRRLPEHSMGKFHPFKGSMTIISGMINNREVIKEAVVGCDGVLTVLVPWGMQQYSSGTAQAVLDYAKPDACLIFS